MVRLFAILICFFVVNAQAQLKSAVELCSNPSKYKQEITAIPDQIKEITLCQGALRLGACLGVVGAAVGGTAATYVYHDLNAKRSFSIQAKAIEKMAPELAKENFENWKKSGAIISPDEMKNKIVELQKELNHYSSEQVAGEFGPLGKIQTGYIVDVPRSAGGTSKGLVMLIEGDHAHVSFLDNGVTKYKWVKTADLKSGDGASIVVRKLRLEIESYKRFIAKGKSIQKPEFVLHSAGDGLIDLRKSSFEQLPKTMQDKYIADATAKATKYFSEIRAGKALPVLGENNPYSKLSLSAFEAAEKEAPGLLKFFSQSSRAMVMLKAGGILAANVVAAATFALTTSNTACDNAGDRFINTDADDNCKPVYQINQNVANFLDMPKDKRNEEILKNKSVCEFNVNLRNSLYMRPDIDEKNVTCSNNGMRITTNDGTRYEVSYYPDLKNIKTILETRWTKTGEAKVGAAPDIEIANLGIEGDFKEGANSVEVFTRANKFIPEVRDCCLAKGDDRNKCWASLSTSTFASVVKSSNNNSNTVK